MCRAVIRVILPRAILAVVMVLVSIAWAQTSEHDGVKQLQVLRESELKSDKLTSSNSIQVLHRHAWVQMLSLEGGWAQVRTAQSSRIGWVRASALNLKTSPSAALAVTQQARESKGNVVFTLGSRNTAKGSNHHALIVTAGRVGGAWLHGTKVDAQTAQQIATALLIPEDNTTYLTGHQVQAKNVLTALQDLTQRLHEGDKAFIYFSGFGGVNRACGSGIVMHDKTILSWQELASALEVLNRKTDRAMVVLDMGFAQPSGIRSRLAHRNKNDEGQLQMKTYTKSFFSKRCALIETELTLKELPQDFVLWQSSASDQTSYDDSDKGGLSTQYLRDCLLRDAKDIDDSADISMEELRQCAQAKIEARLHGDTRAATQTIVLAGNRAYVPIRPQR